MNDRCVCPETVELRALLDDNLPLDAVERITRHVDECVGCQQSLERLATDPVLQKCLCVAGTEQPAPDSAYWQALRNLESIAQPTPARTTPLPEGAANVTAFLEPTAVPGQLGRLGHFEVIRLIGRGGMGLVLLAHDPHLGRDVAIKILDPQLARDQTARQRFCREARAAALVSDDNIVAVHQVSQEESQDLPYIVMQLVEGETLEDRLLREQKLPLHEIVRIGMQIASGLAAAHDKGLIHRDVKPGNILLEKGTDRVKLTDFGLARAAEDLRLTRSGMVAGTPLYMAPEQARGEEVDARADLFSLGVVLYEMATGIPPFQGKTPLAVLRRLADEPHRPVREVNPDIPEWLSWLIDRLLAKSPAQRFQSAREVAGLLEQHYLVLRTSSPEHVICPKRKFRNKIVQLTLTAGAAGVFLTLATLALLRGLRPAPKPPTEPVGPTPWARLDNNDGPVWRVADAPEGLLVAVATEVKGIRFWDPHADRVETTIPHERPVRAVAFSPDGKLLAAGDEEGKLRIYEWPDRVLLHEQELVGSIRTLAFAPDSRKLVVGTWSGKLALYDTKEGTMLARVELREPVSAVAFSRDDKTFAHASTDGSVVLWEWRARTATIEKRFDVVNLKNALMALSFSPDGKILATGGWDGIVRLWDTGSGALRGSLDNEKKQDILSLSFCPGGKVLATGCGDGSIHLWNVPNQQEKLVLKGHDRPVYSVAIARDGKNLASGSRDGSVLMWAIPPFCAE